LGAQAVRSVIRTNIYYVNALKTGLRMLVYSSFWSFAASFRKVILNVFSYLFILKSFYFQMLMTRITLKDWYKTIEIVFQLIRVFLFVASYQHKKSSKLRKLFKIMYYMCLYYNRWVLEPLWRLIMQKDWNKRNKN
jgi:hypothetical protein